MSDLCAICGVLLSNNEHCLSLGDRRKGLPGMWQLVECDHCGAVSMMPMPTDKQLATYYANYAKDTKVDLSQRVGSRYPKLRKLFHCLSGDVDPRDFVQVPVGARVLDYGCGRAGYLSDFHERGVAISGAEIDRNVVDACQLGGFDVRKVDDYSHIPFNDDEFDIVYLMQVFEHLRDPHGFMKELARIMKSNGMLYLAVPNANSIWRTVFGENWVSGWFTPFHLFHYSRDTLARLAGQHGLEVVKSWTSTPAKWLRLNIKAYLYPHESQLDWRPSWLDWRPVGYLLMLVLRILELPFHERDCLVMHLRKRE